MKDDNEITLFTPVDKILVKVMDVKKFEIMFRNLTNFTYQFESFASPGKLNSMESLSLPYKNLDLCTGIQTSEPSRNDGNDKKFQKASNLL